LINTSHQPQLPSSVFCDFLINKIGLSREAVDLGIRHSLEENAPLAIILWQYGLVNSEQYQLILDWNHN
tara:strand:+ start:2030 stop:2236 length:207 start_codon:yes stop_codon:yes gene_type:complete